MRSRCTSGIRSSRSRARRSRAHATRRPRRRSRVNCRSPEQQLQQPPFAAAEIDDARRPRRDERRQHRPAAAPRSGAAAPRPLLDRVGRRARPARPPPARGAPARRASDCAGSAGSARRSARARVRLEPALAAAQQLVDLRLLDPVVLVVVEHRQQHVEVRQQVGEPTPSPSGRSRRTGRRPTPGTARRARAA